MKKVPFQGSKPFVSHLRAKFRRRRSHSNVADLLLALRGKIQRSKPLFCEQPRQSALRGSSAAPATSPATEGAQSAAPATKSAVPVRKAPLLPQNLPLEVLKVLCLPRNLHFQCAKCRSCHEISQSAAPATKSSAHPDSHRAALPRRFAVAGAALCERKF